MNFDISAADKAALDQRGYVVLQGVLTEADLAGLRTAFERAMGPGSPTGTRHAKDLAGRDPMFGAVLETPSVSAVAAHILRRPYRVFQLSGRDPLPGFGQQGLHTDWLPRAPEDPYAVVTALWLLDDFTPDNGATRLIPGSHLSTKPMTRSGTSPMNRHPAELVVTAPAGSVLAFNGHLWHSGTSNRSKGPRRVLQGQFLASDSAAPGQEGQAAHEGAL